MPTAFVDSMFPFMVYCACKPICMDYRIVEPNIIPWGYKNERF